MASPSSTELAKSAQKPDHHAGSDPGPPEDQPRRPIMPAKKLTVDPGGVAGQKRKVEIRAQVERGDWPRNQQARGMANFCVKTISPSPTPLSGESLRQTAR